MLFNSEPYLIFLPIVVALYWVIPTKYRPTFLLGASYYFYASWYPPYLVLIFSMTVANYVIGRIQGNRQPRSKAVLAFSIVANVLALSIFKYLGWLDQSASAFAGLLNLHWPLPIVQLVLPLGLSFFTFEFLHYQIDLYRGYEAIKDPIRFALFPAFFPTQIAGPIKRYEDFDEQVRQHPKFDSRVFLEGIELVIIGLFKKVAIADNIGRLSLLVYSQIGSASGTDALFAALAFYVQVYFDFSSYTDIARGSAQLFGYRIPLNFRAPFLAASFQDFWQRWHMSLSFWLRDYLYYPLGSSKLLRRFKPALRVSIALVITMVVCGLWHGAGLNFALLGLGLGVCLVVDRFMTVRVWRREMPRWLKVAGGWVQTQMLVMLTFVLFPNSAQVAAQAWLHMVTGGVHLNILTPVKVAEIVGVFAITVLVQIALRRWSPRELIAKFEASIVLRPAYTFGLAVVALYFAVGETLFTDAPQRFLYFQF